MVTVKILAFFVFLGVVAAEPVKFTACPGDGGKCTVNAVRVSPCPEATSQRLCKLQRGSSPAIEFDYTTAFDAPKATTQAYWVFFKYDLPLISVEADSCKFTPCPIVKGQKRTFSYSATVPTFFIPGAYDIKWRIAAGEDKECCFEFRVEIVE